MMLKLNHRVQVSNVTFTIYNKKSLLHTRRLFLCQLILLLLNISKNETKNNEHRLVNKHRPLIWVLLNVKSVREKR